MKLRLSDHLSLPPDTVTQAIAILAKRRAGKSYTARRLTEQLFGAGLQVVIVDPKGDWWGVRSSADGRAPGLPIVILGGEHGDVKLEPAGGELVAKLAVEERVSMLLDVSGFRKKEVAQFMTAFLETLYRLKAKEAFRTPVMLVVDEADAIAPQKPHPGEERMLGAAEDIVRRGGQRGIGCTLITQRSAVLNKNVLTQVQMMVALRTIAPQDLAAMKAWIDVHGTPEERDVLMASLPSLPVGDAWFWSPGWPTETGIFKRVTVLPIETFDSGATPKPGERRVQPKNLADVDLAALERHMAETIERAKADDPRELRKQIAALRAELAAAKKAAPAAPAAKEKRVEVKVVPDAQIARLEAALKRGEVVLEKLRAPLEQLRQIEENARAAATEISKAIVGAKTPALPAGGYRGTEARHVVARAGSEGRRGHDPHPPVAAPHHGRRAPAPNGHAEEASDIGAGEKRILAALAQYPEGLTRQQITVLATYKRSTRDLYVQRLGRAGYAEVRGDRIVATPEGVVALGSSYEPLPTGSALREHWLRKLPEGERRVLEVVIGAYPGAVARDAISEAAGYQRSTRDLYLQKLGRRQLVSSTGVGIRASDELFDAAEQPDVRG